MFKEKGTFLHTYDMNGAQCVLGFEYFQNVSDLCSTLQLQHRNASCVDTQMKHSLLLLLLLC